MIVIREFGTGQVPAVERGDALERDAGRIQLGRGRLQPLGGAVEVDEEGGEVQLSTP